MDRRSIFKIVATALAVVPMLTRKSAASEKTIRKMVLHVDQNDPDIMKLALGNARNANELFKAKGEELEVEIVCYHDGLHMLRDDTSPVKEEIKQTRARVPQLMFGACNNTKRGMERREGKIIPIIPEAHVVPAGIVRLVELQDEGFKYVKP